MPERGGGGGRGTYDLCQKFIVTIQRGRDSRRIRGVINDLDGCDGEAEALPSTGGEEPDSMLWGPSSLSRLPLEKKSSSSST